MNETQPSSSRLPVIVGGAVVALLAVVALVWFFGGDDPAAVDSSAALDQAESAGPATPGDEATSDEATGDEATGDEATGDESSAPADDGSADDDDAGAGAGAGPAAASTWTVDTDAVEYSFADGTGSFLGFRIDEELSNVGETEAVGRTPAVGGSLTLDGATVTDATFEGDASALTTDRSQRDRRARGALGDGVLRFALTEPVDLGQQPAPGETVTVEATGDLLVNGVSRSYAVPLEASLSETGLLVVTSSFEVALADHDIEAPSAPIVLGVSDVATVEVQLFLTED